MRRTPAFFLRWPVRHLPVCRVAGRFPMTVPACNRGHRISNLALHLHEYAGTVRIAGKTIRLQPGDITLTPPFAESRYALRESGAHLCIHFVPAAGRGRAAAIRLPLHLRPGPRAVAARERFWRVIDYARQAGDDADSTAAAAASASLQELLLWLRLQGNPQGGGWRPSRADEACARLRDLIDASLAKPMSVPDLARQAGLSPEYLSVLFRRRHVMGIPRYVLLRRIELARHLLRSTTLPIREIGRQCGIPDPQYFNKQFRRVVGESPSRYRWQGGRRPAPSGRPDR